MDEVLKAKELMKKYQEGQLSESDAQLVEEYIEKGILSMNDFHDLNELSVKVDQIIQKPEVSDQLNTNFYQHLERQVAKSHQPGWIKRFADLLVTREHSTRWAVIAGALVAGFLIGQVFNLGTGSKQMNELATEISSMKEMMLLSLIDKESTTDRLRAVALTNEMSGVSERVSQALFYTLNNDENDNVRLAALEALYVYANDPAVRQGLIESIQKQDSPIVQITLAEVMVALQEKKSVVEFREILKRNNLEPTAKKKIEESIEELI